MAALTDRRSDPAEEVLAGQVSVVVACHSMERIDLLVRCVDSAFAQDLAPLEVVVAVDNNELLFQRLSEMYLSEPRVTVVANNGPGGASATRNCGVRAAHHPLVAFLDDDVVADAMWLRRLIAPLSDQSVVGVGGAARPRWQTAEPRWFPEEFLWAVGASYKGMPTSTGDVRNVWSENMAVRRNQFLSCGGFREGFGKKGDASRPEDTEMCIRFSRRSGDRWVYVPDAHIEHFVPDARSTFRFFLNRCHSEGRGKVEMRRLTDAGLSSERSYATRTLPAALGRYTWRAVRGDASALLRLAAVVAGSVSALAGAVRSVLSSPAGSVAAVAPQPAVHSRAG